MACFKSFALPSVTLKLPLFLLLSVFMLMVSTGGTATVASAQDAGQVPSAETHGSNFKDLAASRKKVNFGTRPPDEPSASQIVTIPGVSGSPTQIIRWGNNGLAFSTGAGPLYLIGGNFVH